MHLKQAPSILHCLQHLDIESLYHFHELTYSYKKTTNNQYINTTLFGDREEISKTVYHHTISKLREKNLLVQKYIRDFEALQTRTPREDIFLGMLHYTNTILTIILLGIPFEAEKGGYPCVLGIQERTERVHHLQQLEQSLFGSSISDNSLETTLARNILYTRLLNIQENKLLSPDEYATLETYITRIITLPSFDESLLETIPLPSHINEINERKLWEILKNIQIPRTVYCDIFRLCIAIHGLKKEVLIDETVSSIYNAQDSLHIPAHAKYNALSLQRVLQLISHEIETHFIMSENNKKIIGDFRGGNNLVFEEGVAKASEHLLEGKSLQDFSGITESIPHLLMGEILSGEEFKQYLRLYYAGLGIKTTIRKKILRRKRNYPLDVSAVSLKDVSYARGARSIVSHIQAGADRKSFYSARIGFHDLSTIQKIIKNENITYIVPLSLAYCIKTLVVQSLNTKGNLNEIFTNTTALGSLTATQLTYLLTIVQQIQQYIPSDVRS